jgi:hypothetical protein
MCVFFILFKRQNWKKLLVNVERDFNWNKFVLFAKFQFQQSLFQIALISKNLIF